NGQITVGEMLSFYAYATMLSFPMRQFGKILSKIGVATVAIGRIHEVLDSPLERQDGFARNEKLRGAIEFRDVSFRFDKNARENILKRISFSIQPGEKVALVGATGSGKSTIIKLLVGLYDPDSGQVCIDGHPVEYYSPRYLRQRIGSVLQSPFLFSTTVKHNIAYADPLAPKAKIWASAQLAKADQLESVLPDGYETMVGEKGVTLSGGQKQRVALARTLLTEPDILVLDDVTSAVDTETEQAIFEALQKEQMRKTTIIISHRVTTIQQADRVLVIHQGRIVQEGKPDELANIPGYFRDIHLIQNALEAEIQQNIAVLPN
ncbi:MAG: ABC transporter ATP-binding protein, partial [Calditrichaeota bacterium]|nr:ABC transporter ATP-binding protein [Calditrichota bacterium]